MRTISTLSLALVSFCALARPARSQLQLPRVFGSHMVLQRETVVPVFGSARPGSTVEVMPSWPIAERALTRADASGRFRVDLRTPAAGGPFTVVVASGNQARRFEDVLIGEVWLCSGQSNMELALRSAADSEAAIAAGDRPQIRLFQVRNRVAPAPVDDVEGEWQASTPDTVKDFSAVAHYFARTLETELGVPIGLVQSDWGGTPAEAWTRAEALAPFAEFTAGLARLAAMAIDPDRRAREQAQATAIWQRALDALDRGGVAPGRPLGFASVGLDDSAWESIAVPGKWAGTPLADFDGVAWYRQTVELPSAWRGQPLVLELGTIDDNDETFFDGVRIGKTVGWDRVRSYEIPGRLVRGGNTTLAVRAHDTGGEGGFGGDAAGIRIRRVDDPEGSAAVALAGTWRIARGVAQSELPPPPRVATVGPGDPGSLWNGMIAPLVPFAFRGAIWYQGESNVRRFEQYRTLFPAMIADWRAQFGGGDFPFYFVQIAPFAYGGDTGQAAFLRDAQRRTLDALPDVGMAVTMDIGDPRDIHPRNKQDVGRRLALLALAKTYGKDVECSGPLFAALAPKGAELRVKFTHAAGLRASKAELTGFEIAGDDGIWHVATARIDGETVVLTAETVTAPTRARYAFGAADESTLENAAGLPASSFVSHL